ncbi:hypothetical protein [Rhodospirillum sp. A1_3_36]|uniref:hypothetical protein n=1 Tax=Rhodospirillum sp. A1_3_36 TaxID=3391666 RepID=UPI0039A58DE4
MEIGSVSANTPLSPTQQQGQTQTSPQATEATEKGLEKDGDADDSGRASTVSTNPPAPPPHRGNQVDVYG